MSRVNDLFCILRAIKLISEESISLQQNQLKFIWKNSSLRPLSNELISQAQSKIKTIPKQILATYRLAYRKIQVDFRQ